MKRALVMVRHPAWPRDRCGLINGAVMIRDGRIPLWFGSAGILQVEVTYITAMNNAAVERYPGLRSLLPDVPVLPELDDP